MTANEHIDVTGPTADARAAAQRWAATHPADAENAAVLAELGELLDSGRRDPEYAAECRELITRSIHLGELAQKQWEEDWALWLARRYDGG